MKPVPLWSRILFALVGLFFAGLGLSIVYKGEMPMTHHRTRAEPLTGTDAVISGLCYVLVGLVFIALAVAMRGSRSRS